MNLRVVVTSMYQEAEALKFRLVDVMQFRRGGCATAAPFSERTSFLVKISDICHTTRVWL
jgi:hypothetical protein